MKISAIISTAALFYFEASNIFFAIYSSPLSTHQQYPIIMAKREKIDLRVAVQSVKQYIAEYQDVLGKNLDDLKIEEVELSEDKKYWLITVSFNYEKLPDKQKTYTTNPLFPQMAEIAKQMPQKQIVLIERDYKVFKVDNSTGEVVSMKIYQL